MENFINRNQGNKEPGIIIVDNQSTLLLAIDLLIGYGFSFPQDIKKAIQIVQKSQSICISEEQIKNDAANYYDLLHGISTGDSQTMITVFSKDLNFVIVATSEFIESESNQGRDWLSVCGLSWQFTE